MHPSRVSRVKFDRIDPPCGSPETKEERKKESKGKQQAKRSMEQTRFA